MCLFLTHFIFLLSHGMVQIFWKISPACIIPTSSNLWLMQLEGLAPVAYAGLSQLPAVFPAVTRLFLVIIQPSWKSLELPDCRMINMSGCCSSHQVDPQSRALQNCFSQLTSRQCNGGWASSATALLPPGGEW